MFIYEATTMLKDVICPHCKKDARTDMKYPFKQFDPLELNNKCVDKECMSFFESMAARFSDYESGRINERELQDWLNTFRNGLNSI